MEEHFPVSVTYKGKELVFDATFLSFTYTYKIEVIVDDWLIWFERDDEGSWRGIVKKELKPGIKYPDQELLHLIIQQLKEQFE